MESLNWKRIVGGGLLAGLVIVAGEIGAEPIAAGQMESLFSRLGLTPPGEGAMMVTALIGLLLGIITVWLYAVLRPWYHSEGQAAFCAGVTAWLLSCALPMTSFLAFGIVTASFFGIALVKSLVTGVLAAFVGAWMYRRRGARAGALAGA